ncbi:MAG: FAD-binding oxidoreductase, partial [Terriglobia bacterium]
MSLAALPEPDRGIMARRNLIVEDLRKLVGAEAIIDDEVGRRTYETDALTAYKRLPLAVALPTSTEQVSRLLK